MDLNQIKPSYQHQNIDLNEMKKQYNEYRNALKSIRKNKDLAVDHPTILEQNQVLLLNNDYHSKYKK